MVITEGQVAQVASELKSRRGGVDNDYFGLLFLEKEFKLSREDACDQIAYGGNDFGIDGYHVDRQTRNFHLLQFKFSKSADQFIGSMQRLLTAGLARVFDVKIQQAENPILREIRAKLYELRNIIETVYLEFIFIGDPDKAHENEALQKLREDAGRPVACFRRPSVGYVAAGRSEPRSVGTRRGGRNHRCERPSRHRQDDFASRYRRRVRARPGTGYGNVRRP